MQVAKPKQREYEDFFDGLDTKEGEVHHYWLARQRDRHGLMQQVGVIKYKDRHVFTGSKV